MTDPAASLASAAGWRPALLAIILLLLPVPALAVIPYPQIDPVLVAIGPLAIRWYALAYIAGILLGWRYAVWLARREPRLFDPQVIDDFVVWATLGIVLGGRLGYVLFYRPGHYLENPLEALMLWQGGMAFHGGLVGVVLAVVLFCRRHRVPFLPLADVVCAAVPIGLLFGRIANFINGELYGRPGDVPWAMVFPHAGPVPRHPSQLYEALLEGLVLFALLFVLAVAGNARRWPGLLAGTFLIGYAIARIVAELFREPDWFLGFLPLATTMGQWLSLPMLLIGVWLVLRARRSAPV